MISQPSALIAHLVIKRFRCSEVFDRDASRQDYLNTERAPIGALGRAALYGLLRRKRWLLPITLSFVSPRFRGLMSAD